MAHHSTVTVQLTPSTTNTFQLIGQCVSVARKAQISKAEIEAFLAETRQQPTYEDALEVCRRWFSVGEGLN